MPYVTGVGNEVIATLIVVFIVVLTALSIPSVRRHIINFFARAQRGEIDDTATQVLRQRTYPSELCSICLRPMRLALETNCGHLFCGKCLTTYWRRGNFGIQAMHCPLCRQSVNMIFSSFNQEEQAAADTTSLGQRRGRLLTTMHTYNNMHSRQARSLSQIIWDIPTLARHLASDMMTMEGLSWMVKFHILITGICSLIYILSPIDLFPESVLGIVGLMDDAFIICLGIIYICSTYREFILSQGYNNSDPDDLSDSEDEPSAT